MEFGLGVSVSRSLLLLGITLTNHSNWVGAKLMN